MPSGGGKGSKPAGTTTTITQNPTQIAQLPFLTGQAITDAGLPGAAGWNQAANLAVGNPYTYFPGQTLADFNPYLPSGYNQMALAAENANGSLLPQGNSIFSSAANGGMGIYGSPAFGGLADLSSGTNAYEQGLGTFGAASAANPYSSMLANLSNQVATGPNGGMDELSKTASGAYLNSNPYLDQMFGSASDAVTRAYQNATAPTTASNFSGAGRYGSGAYTNSVSQNQQDLGSSLNNLSSNIYGGNYQAERTRQDAAGQALGALIAQNYGLQGNMLNAAGTQYLTGLSQAANDYKTAGGLQLGALGSLQSGYQAGNANQMQALSMFPSLLNAQYSPSQAMIQAGQGLTGLDQQQIQDQMNRFYGQIDAPWKTNQAYLNQVGQPTTGSSQTQQPYFQNQLANLLGGATGGLGLYNGLSSAFGKGGGAGAGLTAADFSAGLGESLAGAGALGGLGEATSVATLAPEVAALFF